MSTPPPPSPADAPRRLVASGTPWEGRVGYSRAVRVGAHVYVSGTTGTGPDGRIAEPGDAHAQACRAIANIAAALEQAGATLADVVRTRMFVTDVSRWKEVGRAHAAAFGAVRPATAMYEVKGLVDPDMLVEIEADAIVGSALSGSAGGA